MLSLPIVEIDNTRSPRVDDAAGSQLPVRGKYSFISLGCPKNLVDSEQMLGLLQEDGYRLVSEPEQSDFVVINTCGFIDSARKESFGAIDQMLELKRKGKIKGVIVSGCLAERQREQLLEARPEIDGLVGVFGRDEITSLAKRFTLDAVSDLNEQRTVFKPAPIRALADEHRLQVTPRHFAYLKISEGCDRLCTFCAIPKMRGKHASKPMDSILREANRLADSGVRELIIVAQDTTYYGIDIDGKPQLATLLQKLNEIDGFDWIRLMYFYPMYIDDQLIKTIADSKKIIPYIDMPLQHVNDVMLKRMSRRVDRQQTESLVGRLREGIPNLTLRTTMITGFPGETDEQFDELEAFVDLAKFERLGVFTYSIEPDTPAAKLPGHLPERIKKERRQRLMAIQQQNAFDWCQTQVGRSMPMIIDRVFDESKNVFIARTHADAPDVDSVVYLTADPSHNVAVGDIVGAEVVAFKDYDLVAVTL